MPLRPAPQYPLAQILHQAQIWRMKHIAKRIATRGALVLALPLALAACDPASVAPGGPGSEPPILPALPPPDQDTCDANRYVSQIGQPATSLERLMILGPVRVIRPDTAVTMDFREDRINFYVDGSGLITNILCG